MQIPWKHAHTHTHMTQDTPLSDLNSCLFTKVYERCAGGLFRSSNGLCVDKTTFCQESCEPHDGELIGAVGLCTCLNQKVPEAVCDFSCRAKQTKARFNQTTIAFEDPGSNSASFFYNTRR